MSVIEVYRGDGLRSGAPIVETLLSDDALLARGIAEMDRNAHAVNQVDMEVVFRPGLRLGQLIEANDPARGRKLVWRGLMRFPLACVR